MDLLTIADLALEILKPIMQEISERVGSGLITKEEQQERLNKLEALRAGKFDGIEWRKSTDSV